jgi:iron complex outermembrane receptor protein
LPLSALAQTNALPASGNQSNAGLEEIIVTAQRREQNLQNVPITVTAFSADDLVKANVTNVVDLSKIDSSFYVGEATGAIVTFVRGLGNPIGNVGNESSVAYYIDGVYYARLPEAYFNFNNVERVEALAGPQGTLFGRNASGGLVQIITKDPSHDPTLNVDVGYGNFDTTTVHAYASDGFGEKIAGDLAIIYNDQGDGWGHNSTTGHRYGFDDYEAVRSKWNFDFTENTSAKLTLDYNQSREDTGIDANQYQGTTSGPLVPPFQRIFPVSFYNANTAIDPLSVDDGWSITAKVTHDFPFMTVSSVSNYQHLKENIYEDAANVPLPTEVAYLTSVTNTYSEEIQFQSLKGSPIDWTGGLYYLNEIARYNPALLSGQAISAALKTLGADISNIASLRTQSFSGYGQATFHVSDMSDVTAGVRYNYDPVHAYGVENAVLDSVPFKTLANVDARDTFDKTTFKFAFDHHFSQEIMSYVSYSSGFKDGTYNLLTIAPTPVKPEVIDAYEIGTKAFFFDNRLRMNVALFYNELHDPQVREYGVNQVSIVTNAQSAFSKGIDFSVDGKVSQNLTARFGTSVLDARYKNFNNAPSTSRNPNSPYGNLPFTSINADGKWLTHASPLTLTGGLDYVVPMSFGTWDFDLSDYYNAGFYWDPDNVIRQRAYNIVDSDLVLELPDHHWKVALWGKNITNTHYYLYEAEFGSASGNGSAAAPPATYGIRFSYKY